MPLPFLPTVSDSVLFDALNPVMIGYICLIFAPRWRRTQTVVFGLVFTYSVLYALLVAHRVSARPLPPGAGIDSLAGIQALFSDEAIIFAGWTHYIAFDLFVSSYIVSDAHVSGVPHLAIVWTLPLTLMAGPAGLAAYMTTKTLWLYFVGKTTPSDDAGFLETKMKELRQSLALSPVLTILYVCVTGLALFMVSWVLVIPSSWLVGNSEVHDTMLAEYWDNKSGPYPTVTPKSLVFKYKTHWAVQFSHILPSAIWSASIPIQLYPGMRRSHPRLHRWTGYAFTSSALLMMGGLVVIDYRRLYYFQNDFPGIPEHEAMSRFPILADLPHRELFLGLGIWFTVCLLYSIRSAQKKKFAAHKAFMYRHIAAGIWVAVQRLYVFGIGAAMHLAGHNAEDPVQQKQNFGDGAMLGFLATVFSAEVAVYLSGKKPSAPKAE